jgi:hypothetical protein
MLKPSSALVLGLVLGCGPRVTPAPRATTVAHDEAREEAAPQTPSCPPGLADLDNTLRSLAGAFVRDAAALPVAANAPAITAGPVLEVSADMLTLDGHRVTQSELGEHLAALRQTGPQLGHEPPTHILVAAAASLPASTLTTLLTSIPAEWHVQVLTRSAPVESASQDCASLQGAIEQATGACEGARTASRAFVSCVEQPAPMLGSEPSLVEALESCGCDGANLDAIATIARQAHDRTYASHGYSLDNPRGGRMNARALRLPRTATVQDLVARLETPPAR